MRLLGSHIHGRKDGHELPKTSRPPILQRPGESMKAAKYAKCQRCKRRLQVNSKGHLRPHAVPKQMRKDTSKHESCEAT